MNYRKDIPWWGVALLIGLLLFVSFFTTSPFADPYQNPEIHFNTISHESTEPYDGLVEQYNLTEDDLITEVELSPLAREWVKYTLSEGDPPPKEWKSEEVRTWNPNVCREFMLYCDTYSESPDEFAYGFTDEQQAYLVEYEDERYVLTTDPQGSVAHLEFIQLAAKIVVLLLTGGAIAIAGAMRQRLPEKSQMQFAGAGTALLLYAYTTPYISMLTDFSNQLLYYIGIWAAGIVCLAIAWDLLLNELLDRI